MQVQTSDSLDDECNPTGDGEGDEQRLPGAVLKRLPAEVAEQSRVAGPERGGDGVVGDEATEPRILDGPCGEHRRDASAWDEARHDDEQPTALVEGLRRPRQPAPAFLAAEELLRSTAPEPTADPVGQIVAGE